jgi:hypothetical protein
VNDLIAKEQRAVRTALRFLRLQVAPTLANLKPTHHVEVRRGRRPYRYRGCVRDLTAKEQRPVRTTLLFLRARAEDA